MSLFFFNDTATTEIYTLSLHDALPISVEKRPICQAPLWSSARLLLRKLIGLGLGVYCGAWRTKCLADRKSTRLNSSHANISYAVFCLKKKKPVVHLYISYHPPSVPHES